MNTKVMRDANLVIEICVSTCSCNLSIFAVACEGAHSAAIASMKQITVSRCSSQSIPLRQFFKIPRTAPYVYIKHEVQREGHQDLKALKS